MSKIAKNTITDLDLQAAKRAFDAMMNMGKIDIAAIKAARRDGGGSCA